MLGIWSGNSGVRYGSRLCENCEVRTPEPHMGLGHEGACDWIDHRPLTAASAF